MSNSATTESELPTQIELFLWRRKYWLIFLSFSIAFVGARLLAPAPFEQERRPSGVQAAHEIGLAMYSYAQDHDGKYPSGQSSTEVFQQLLDQSYVTDPALFYFPLAGKTQATSSKLKPENVCWDVTDAVTPDDPDGIPLVFWTGCKIRYTPGATSRILAQSASDGIAVFYKNNFAFFRPSTPDGIPIIDPTFDPKGKTYRQLTPDGPLP